MRPTRLFNRIAAGAVGNVDFGDLITLLETMGFKEVGGRGSHRVFVRQGVAEILTLQETHGQAKPYQVRQVVALIRQYNLSLEGEL
ncbi:MAG TPA: type II toxin-antitoxin system HicA family toxin [Streptosporangiaceae bacterium]